MITQLSLAPNLEAALLLATPLLPLLIALFFIVPAWRFGALTLAPYAGLAGLLTSLLVRTDTTLDLTWHLLGTRLGLDEIGQTFLLFTALLWLLAGLFSHRYMEQYHHQAGFTAFYLLAMSGNFGLVLAQDFASFYFFFALMSFASYVLVIHNRDEFANYASRVYIILVIIGELMVFTALILMATQTNTIYIGELSGLPVSPVVIGLVLLGFGIKAGALPLHFWLPLAHPAAPVPASAVLSGAMIKAGLIGWLRFLPLGNQALPDWGYVVIIAGLTAAFYGAFVGISQSNPKTVLAYSSISQMGLMTIGVGIGLIEPDLWSVVLPAILLYALHHGLAKGALFLGVGISTAKLSKLSRRWTTAAMLLPALALAGAPFTSGILAKSALKNAIPSLPSPWPAWLDSLLPLAAVGTTLLMARFCYHIWYQSPGKKPLPASTLFSWVILLFCVATFTWIIPAAADFRSYSLRLNTIWLGLWPIGLGLLVSLLGSFVASRKEGIHYPNIPAGDLVVLIEWVAKMIERPSLNWISVIFKDLMVAVWSIKQKSMQLHLMSKIERHFADFTVIGVLLLATALVIFMITLTNP
jgi:formate hydrogenlyase subunit 3/multisubunit Na+/H+ antiporter MnhD subunit